MKEKLQQFGYEYLNIDSFWALDVTRHVDEYGRWLTDSQRFPLGMADMASHVHANGQKIGIYFNPGIAVAAVNQNTPIMGTSCRARDIIVQPQTAGNVFGNTYKINFSHPCAQSYVNSQVQQLVDWGIDLIKMDAVSPGSGDTHLDCRDDVKAWSTALHGRDIWFGLSWSLDIDNISFWRSHANSWRIDTDVDCYCPTLVTWEHSVVLRFTDAIQWTQWAGAGGWNDLDSVNVGDALMSGLSADERQTCVTLWVIVAAPLYTGSDLTRMDELGLSLLTNTEVIAVQQEANPAKLVSQLGQTQVWSSRSSDGSFVVAMINLDKSSQTVTIKWKDLGIVSSSAMVRDLWSHTDLGLFRAAFTAVLNTHASRLIRVHPQSRTNSIISS
eukprot:TRINITY_DN9409_c0_g2_i1.p1 TRINITY_DN9409_c0_g2~~TRINITY_DN9409_c0_g2_i1.p1  ORF type:complete len:385 (+),score=87.19 TRINITY_DN9409_c0_g2_i1:240-1394(+)